MSYNLTGATVSSTYGRIVQVVLGTPNTYYDGFGTLLDLGPGTYSVGPVGPTGATGANGTSLYWAGSWDDMMLYSFYDIVSYNGNTYLCIDSLTPGPTYSSPDLDLVHWTLMIAGITGSTGPQGPIGPTGSSGFHTAIGVTSASYSIVIDNTPTQYFGISHSSTSATITIPDYTSDGKVVIIKDESGNAATFPITVNASKIDQSNQAIIALDNGSITLMWRVNTWWII
jgi:hypothetical protein